MSPELQGETELKVEQLYAFLEKLYSANWIVRFGSAPFMKGVSQQNEVDELIERKGVIESVGGHSWTLTSMVMLTLEMFPGLRRAINGTEAIWLALFHDVRELDGSETSAAQQLNGGNTERKEAESKFWRSVCDLLPDSIGNQLFEHCEIFEKTVKGEQTLAKRFVRFLDDLEAGRFIHMYGNDFEMHSDTANKIGQRRLAPWARELIDELQRQGYHDGAQEIELLVTTHIRSMRQKGMKLDFAAFGFV